jgi:hypothetical protein
MQTTFRLKSKEISATFLKSLKTLFAGQEVEITVRSVEPSTPEMSPEVKNALLEMIRDNRLNAPVISPDIDIRGLIDESQYPS